MLSNACKLHLNYFFFLMSKILIGICSTCMDVNTHRHIDVLISDNYLWKLHW
jgi:hypothetical protein